MNISRQLIDGKYLYSWLSLRLFSRSGTIFACNDVHQFTPPVELISRALKLERVFFGRTFEPEVTWLLSHLCWLTFSTCSEQNQTLYFAVGPFSANTVPQPRPWAHLQRNVSVPKVTMKLNGPTTVPSLPTSFPKVQFIQCCGSSDNLQNGHCKLHHTRWFQASAAK